jgi:hypothetical protein
MAVTGASLTIASNAEKRERMSDAYSNIAEVMAEISEGGA